ncbi:hypothetical protein GCM10027051_11870 [Niabella terrae]
MKTAAKQGNDLINQSPFLFGILVTAILFSTSVFVIGLRKDTSLSANQLELSRKSDEISQRFSAYFNELYSSLVMVARIVDADGNVNNFKATAKEVRQLNPHIHYVTLSPDAVIRYTYPASLRSLNKDILTATTLEEQATAKATLTSKQIVLSGPFRTFDNDSAVVARMPIYLKGEFWGFTSVLVQLKDAIKTIILSDEDSSRYVYHISHTGLTDKKETFFYNGTPDLSRKDFNVETIPNINWKLYIVPRKRAYNPSLLPVILSFLGSILLGVIAKKWFERPFRLQSLLLEKERGIAAVEHQFAAIFEDSPIGLAIIDNASGHITVTNKKFCNIFGYEKADILSGIRMRSLVPRQVYWEVTRQLPALISGQKSEINIDYRHTKENGETITTYARIFLLDHNNRDNIRYVISAEDITERVRAEEKIRESDKRYQLLFNESPVSLWEEDFSAVVAQLRFDGLMGQPQARVLKYFRENPDATMEYMKLVRVTAFNDECVRQHKALNKEDLMQNFMQYIMTAETQTVTQKILAAICAGKHQFQSESTFRDRFGALGNSLLKWQVIPGHEHNYDHVILTTSDVTDLKRSKAQLESATIRLQSLLDHINGIVWAADPATLLYTFSSRKAVTITGQKQAKWLGKSVLKRDFLHPEDLERILPELEDHLRKNKHYESQFRVKTWDNKTKWYRETIDCIRENSYGPGVIIGVMIDITDLRNSEQQLAESLDILREQNKRLMNFSYIVSHNLRSHVSNMSSLCDLINASNDEAEKGELIAALISVSGILHTTMQGLNEVVNIHSQLDYTKHRLSLKTVIDHTIKILQDKIRAKEAIVLNNVPEDVVIDYNKSYLESIILNLISNAIKYSKPQTFPLVSLTYAEENMERVLIIKDNGIGIDMEQNGQKLFGLFKTFTHNPDSKGIGLYITKNQVEAMGGRIEVESQPEKGSTFKIYF